MSGLNVFHTKSLLSLPPEANYYSPKDHLSPHTSCLWPTRWDMKLSFVHISLSKMPLSQDPEASKELDQAKEPTLLVCPEKFQIILHFTTSQIWTYPSFVPIPMHVPLLDQFIEATELSGPKSASLVTREVTADQRYILLANPTARILEELQSKRLR